jgi:two-component system LytT family response regulator
MRDAAPAPDRVRTIVVDDEPLARANLRVLLRSDPGIALIAECGSGRDAFTQIRALAPDLVLLDVEMPEIDGFDVLELLGREAPPAIVFVTAFDSYALRAFEAGALDYLLKPFDAARLTRAVARATERVALARLRRAVPDVIALKSAGRVAFVKIAEIDWVEAADYYARLHVGPASHLVRRSIADLERDLDGAGFCRIHRSSIVRIECIRGLELNADGEYDVVLKTGTRLRSSRGYRKKLKARLEARSLGPQPR